MIGRHVYRYFVITWDHRNAQASSDAALIERRLREFSLAWTTVLNEPGVRAFESGAGGVAATSRDQSTSCEARALTGAARGVVFGRLFRTGTEPQGRDLQSPIDASESERIAGTAGQHLLDRYWGRYVAVICEPSGAGGAHILRDPTGGLPCYLAEFRGVRLAFSDINTCLDLKLLHLSLNWHYLASVVPYSALQIRETGLHEVLELQAGERVYLGRSEPQFVLLWKPSELASRHRIEDPELAVASVRETVRSCIHTWASLHRSLIMNLSGGLDSSIVLGCLRTAPSNPHITCLHYFSSTTGEDERECARLMARHTGTDLVERDLDPAAADLTRLLEIRLAPKPWFYLYDLIHSPVEVALQSERGATALFSGSGGDGLFVQARADLAVADYLRHHGFSPGVLRVAHDAARINRASIWPTLREGIRRHWKRPSPNALSEFGDPRALIPPDVYERARNDDSLFHPWIRAARNITPGLLWQILSMSVPPQLYESFGGPTEIERTPVLLSQPIIEMCLRIPTYVWIVGGRDRAIARRAFADVLPRQVVRRTSKGLIDRYNRIMLDRNASFLREMLLDGELVRAGLLDRARLAVSLEPGIISTSFEYNEVLRQHLCTEIWIRRWRAVTTSSAG